MKKTKFNMTLLSSSQLSKLLRLGRDVTKGSESDSIKELFETYWKESPSNVVDNADFPYGYTVRSLGEILTDPNTQIRVLKHVKSCFKRKLSAASDEDEKEIAGIYYHAAIAAAIAFHSKRITTLSDRDVYDTLLSIKNKKYLPGNLKRLFSNGVAVLLEDLNNQ